jgi:DNA-binding NtrC family response regulator
MQTATQLRVIVVEDDLMIMKLVGHMLAEADVDMTPAGGDAAALMDESKWDEVDVAIVDLLLPKVAGDDLLDWLAEHAPHVRRIAMSGSGPWRLEKATSADVRLLKPFMIDDLLTALRP